MCSSIVSFVSDEVNSFLSPGRRWKSSVSVDGISQVDGARINQSKSEINHNQWLAFTAKQFCCHSPTFLATVFIETETWHWFKASPLKLHLGICYDAVIDIASPMLICCRCLYNLLVIFCLFWIVIKTCYLTLNNSSCCILRLTLEWVQLLVQLCKELNHDLFPITLTIKS